jgi:hypothetical protein
MQHAERQPPVESVKLVKVTSFAPSLFGRRLVLGFCVFHSFAVVLPPQRFAVCAVEGAQHAREMKSGPGPKNNSLSLRRTC